jgi:hypothetical protein
MYVNIPVQGGAADYCKLAMVRSKRELIRRGWWGTSVRLLMNQHDSLVYEVSNTLSLTEVRDILQPQVSFPLATFPALPPMEVDWEYGQRWGSVIPLVGEPETFETLAPPAALETVDRGEVDFAGELVLRFGQELTDDEARHLLTILRGFPGDNAVVLALADREVPVRGTRVLADTDFFASLARFDCQVELRQMA